MEKQLEFPMDIYPPSLRQIIEDTHRDLNFPVNYIAASLLLAVSVAVGNSCVLKVCDGWRVKPILYMTLVGSPGSVKTHPVSFALTPFRRSDDYTLGKYASELEEYRRQMMMERGEKPKGSSSSSRTRPLRRWRRCFIPILTGYACIPTNSTAGSVLSINITDPEVIRSNG